MIEMHRRFVTFVPNRVKFAERFFSGAYQNSFILVSVRNRLISTRIICSAKSAFP